MTDQKTRIFIAGHLGMVGSALVRSLEKVGGVKLISRTRKELDLTRQRQVEDFLGDECIDEIYLAAAKVGGIQSNNSYPAEFIYENLLIESNVIHGAYRSGVRNLLLLGSSCIYPRNAQQPIRESALLTGVLELTNEPYSIAKIAGIKLCESYNRQHRTDFRSVMPANLYGPNDNFDLQNSHVLPALMRKTHQAMLDGSRAVGVWGSGEPRREFLHVDDLAAACVHIMSLSSEEYWSVAQTRCSHVNVGAGKDLTIRELAELVADVAGFGGELEFDRSKPDGTPRKLLDVSKMEALGWSPEIEFREGVRSAYEWMVEHWDEVVD
jgi:GDP-L-fucose synthase